MIALFFCRCGRAPRLLLCARARARASVPVGPAESRAQRVVACTQCRTQHACCIHAALSDETTLWSVLTPVSPFLCVSFSSLSLSLFLCALTALCASSARPSSARRVPRTRASISDHESRKMAASGDAIPPPQRAPGHDAAKNWQEESRACKGGATRVQGGDRPLMRHGQRTLPKKKKGTQRIPLTTRSTGPRIKPNHARRHAGRLGAWGRRPGRHRLVGSIGRIQEAAARRAAPPFFASHEPKTASGPTTLAHAAHVGRPRRT